ncbi:MAG: hypothetical protein HKN70_09445 [Gammaproteobacteria bacterium]|nr:hypothetical protein [Gammaproteobacteria bacterium]
MPIDDSFVDDGTDYYSASAQTQGSLSIFRKQWITDADGNRVYTMNTHEALGNNRYYVGDIRYLPASRAQSREPLYYDRWGNPVYQINGNFAGNSARYPYSYSGSSRGRPILNTRTPVARGTNTSGAAPVARPAPVSRPPPSRVRDYRHMDSPRQRPRAPDDTRRTSN